MGTVATGTKTHGLAVIPGVGFQAIYEVVLDTTDAAGEQTLDLTADFKYVYSVEIGGSDATTGYHVEVEKPAYDTALTSTNLKLGFYEAGADGAVLDLMNATDMSSAITGLTVKVTGAKADVSSWA